MAKNTPIPYEVASKLASRAITNTETLQIKTLRDLGYTRDDALLAVKGKPEAKAEAIARYPEVTLPEDLAA